MVYLDIKFFADYYSWKFILLKYDMNRQGVAISLIKNEGFC